MFAEKLNPPGFYDAIVIASKLFEFESNNHILRHWRYVRQYLSCYEVSVASITEKEAATHNVKPLNTEKDFEIAKHVMLNLFNYGW